MMLRYPRANRPREKRRIPSRIGRATAGDHKGEEWLSGAVRGRPATSGEEYFARALDKSPRVREYTFRDHFLGPFRVPGSMEVDFLVSTGNEVWPIQLDGEYAHKSAIQRETDRLKDARLSEELRQMGIMQPVIRIPNDGIPWYPETPELADLIVEELFP